MIENLVDDTAIKNLCIMGVFFVFPYMTIMRIMGIMGFLPLALPTNESVMKVGYRSNLRCNPPPQPGCDRHITRDYEPFLSGEIST